jgi:pimeloyl-ACP methyl ester carboxylesterase
MNFVLVHGSYHGAWCWDRLRAELESRGNSVTAMDMPISQPRAVTGGYADAVLAAMGGVDDPVLVGHSMGGLVIPLVADRLVAAGRPVRKLIFLAAFLPLPGKSIADQRAEESIDGTFAPSSSEWTDMGDNVWMVGPNTATEIFYSDLAPDDAAWATVRLRPQCYDFMAEVTPLAAWPDVECASIVCRDDHAISADWVRTAARERLGVQAVEIPGGHSPFLSRPADLADQLLTLA